MEKKISLVEEYFLSESRQGGEFWYIEGIFAQADVPNKNKRIYPEKTLDREMNKFNEEFVKINRAAGELMHPSSSAINPDRVAIKIEYLEKDGKNWNGRAKVLNTVCGKTVSAMLEGGLVTGVSTRGNGTTRASAQRGLSQVNDDYQMFTIDSVMNPSAPKALVDAIYEDTMYENLLEKELLFEEFLQFLKKKEEIKSVPNKVDREAKMIEQVSALIKRLTR